MCLRLSPSWKEIRYFHGKHHITSHFEFASHKGIHRIQFTFSNGKPILIADSESDIGLFNAARNNLALAIDDLESPFPSLISCDVPLKSFSHACCCRRIKYFWHCCETLGDCHSCSPKSFFEM